MKSETPVLCVVSERFRFICLLIAKNASSTLRDEFGRDFYGSYEQHYAEIDRSIRDTYFTFAPVRDPVSRLLSAYQEISIRFENGRARYTEHEFFLMSDTPKRFASFLNALEDTGWDEHVVPQVRYLEGVRVDLFARVERLQDGIDEMFRRLEMGRSPVLPTSRSRRKRKEVEGYDRFNISARDLDASILSRIEQIYDADLRLYESLFPNDRPWKQIGGTTAKGVSQPPTASSGRGSLSRVCEGYPQRRRLVKVRRYGDEWIATSKLKRRHVRLNKTGAAIWSLCDGETSVAAICAALSARFETAEAFIRADVMSTLRQLESSGVLKFRSAPRRRRGTRRIDLRKISFYVINCEADTLRRDSMQQQLARLGLRYEFVDGMACDVRRIGTTVSHLRVLNRQDIHPPFAVLEDDCVFNENFRYEFTVPSGADALYLGVSHFGIEHPGRLSWGKGNRVEWERYDRDNLRIFNMLSAHAIVYLSERFRRAALRAQIDALCDAGCFPGDVGLASTQMSHLVLTPVLPICHQASELGGHQVATQRALIERERR